jgi:uncharacterized membrane protein (DUF2068 family)
MNLVWVGVLVAALVVTAAISAWGLWKTTKFS